MSICRHIIYRMHWIYFISFLFLMCCEEPEIESIKDKNLLWYKQNVSNHIEQKVDYEGKLLFYYLKKDGSKGEFNLIDPFTGQETFLNTIISNENELFGSIYHNNKAVIKVGVNFVFIDLVNGSLEQIPAYLPLPVIFENEGFTTDYANDHITHKKNDVKKINLITNEIETIYSADLVLPETFDTFFPLGGYSRVELYKKSGNLNSLILYGEYYGDSTNGRHWIDFIDPVSLTKQTDSLAIIGNVMDNWIDEENDKMYVINSAFYSNQYMVVVYAIDLLTKQILWEKRYMDVVWSGGMVLAQNKLFYIIDGVPEGTMYSVDPQTGQHLWVNKTKAGVLTSQLQELNGIIYFTSSNSGRIHAIDINTGQDLWNKRPPVDYGSYTTACYVVEGNEEKKGVVIGITWDEIFAYEAIK